MGYSDYTIIYFISWWVIFLSILPIGNRTEHSDDPEIDNAPVHMRIKLIITTIVNIPITAIAFYIIKIKTDM